VAESPVAALTRRQHLDLHPRDLGVGHKHELGDPVPHFNRVRLDGIGVHE